MAFFKKKFQEKDNRPHGSTDKKPQKKWLKKGGQDQEGENTKDSLTEYCGGKVTIECIKRALKDKNPAIRKKAQFALAAFKMKGKTNEGETTKEEEDTEK